MNYHKARPAQASAQSALDKLDRSRLEQIEAKYSTAEGATEAEWREAQRLAGLPEFAAFHSLPDGGFRVSAFGQHLATIEGDKATAEMLASVANDAVRYSGRDKLLSLLIRYVELEEQSAPYSSSPLREEARAAITQAMPWLEATQST